MRRGALRRTFLATFLVAFLGSAAPSAASVLFNGFGNGAPGAVYFDGYDCTRVGECTGHARVIPGCPGGKPFKAVKVKIRDNRFSYDGVGTLYTGLDSGPETVRRKLSFNGRVLSSKRGTLRWTTGPGSYPGNPGCGGRTYKIKLRCAQQRCLSFTREAKPLLVDFDVAVDRAGCAVRFTSESSGGRLRHTWDFGGQGEADGEAGRTPRFFYRQAGRYTVVLTVRDRLGRVGRSTHAVALGERKCAAASFTYEVVGGSGCQVEFFGKAVGRSPAKYAWDFGGKAAYGAESTSTEQNPSFLYHGPGTYTVKLGIADKMGRTATTTQSITLTDPPSDARCPATLDAESPPEET